MWSCIAFNVVLCAISINGLSFTLQKYDKCLERRSNLYKIFNIDVRFGRIDVSLHSNSFRDYGEDKDGQGDAGKD